MNKYKHKKDLRSLKSTKIVRKFFLDVCQKSSVFVAMAEEINWTKEASFETMTLGIFPSTLLSFGGLEAILREKK